jgi:hypothetical protein
MMRTHHGRTLKVLIIAAVLLAFGVLLVPAPADALSCDGLANAMFSSKHHAVYWAKRYYAAGCGD